MSEEKQLPAEQQAPAMQPPMNPMNTGVTKASEKVEMQRVTADVYAMHQRAMQYGRDEKSCYAALEKLCENVDFASALMYRVARGDDKVEGIGIDGANEIARVWGHIDSGSVVHGHYGDEVQMEAFAIDLVGPRRRSSRFSVKTTRTYENKDQVTGKVTYNTVPIKNIDDIAKGTAAKEERNCILDVIPSWVRNGMIKAANRTILATVSDIPKAFALNVDRFKQAGVNEDMLWSYIHKKPEAKGDRFAKVTAADIVDLRLLSTSAREDISILDYYFPTRDKKSGKEMSAEVATEPPKSKPATSAEKPATEPPKTSSATPTDSGTKPSTSAVATEPPKPKGAKPAPAAAQASSAPAATAPITPPSASVPATSVEPAADPKPEEPASAPVDAESPSTQEEQDSATTATSETAESESEPENDAPEENDTEPEPEQEAAPAEAPAKKRGVDLW